MALDDDIRILSTVRLFEGFTAEQLRLLAFGAETTSLPAERKLYREDDEADSAYVVISGSIALYREAEGTRIIIASAAADSQVLRLNRKMFRRILEEYPDIAVHLHQRITDELQALIERIEALAPRFAG